MIKNIIFDMGNVLLQYESMRVCRVHLQEEADQKKVCAALFGSPEWLALDRGTMTEEKAMEAVKARLDEDYLKEAAQQCMDDWDKYCMWEKEGMRDVVKSLKERGFHIYLLSNVSLRIHNFIQTIPGIELFDGTVFSAEEKCIKPEPEIYQRLFERFQLVPEECFFIDDVQANIDAGKKLGMPGHCFADGDVKKLRDVLEDEKFGR